MDELSSMLAKISRGREKGIRGAGLVRLRGRAAVRRPAPEVAPALCKVGKNSILVSLEVGSNVIYNEGE